GTPNTGNIRNVSIYVDGIQVVSGRTVSLDGTAVSLTNLGSMIVNMGATSIIEVKADIASSTGEALTTNSLKTNLTVEVQGQDSKNSISLAAIDSNSVTVGGMNASFTNNSNFTGSKATSNQSNVKVGSFLLSTGNEAVRLTSLNVLFTPGSGLNLSSVSNFRLMDGSTQIWSQSSVGSGLSISTVSTSPYLEIPANTTKTFDVVVDLNNAGATGTLAVTGTASYQGVISLSTQAANQTLAAQNTTLATPTLASVTKSAKALSDRYVTGGVVNNAAVFTLTASGASFTTSKLQVTVSEPATVSSVSINGTLATYRGNGVYSADTSVNVATIGTDVPVTVTFNNANRDTNSLHGETTTVALSYVASGDNGFLNVGTEDVASTTPSWNSSTFTLVGAYPQVKMTANTNINRTAGTLSNVSVGTIEITPVGGTVSVSQVKVNLSGVPTYTSARVVDQSGNVVSGATVATSTGVVTLPTGNISTLTKYTIQVSGSIAPSVTNTVDIGANLGDVSGLTWKDVTGDPSNGDIIGNALLPNYGN
ncbi:MAG TPA: hypothetical protein PLE26_02370, partial [Candidatus Paceibacterota bacterium]|nr:hypothetical protein [Candidatus Paceibacterota bacterium]